MRFAVLGSGSGGNSTVVECDGRYLLVDAGLSAKQLILRLECLGLSPENLAGILLTHEHGDHVRGLDVFLRKFRVPLVASTMTGRVVQESLREPVQWVAFERGQQFHWAGFDLATFAISHDAVEPVGYVIGRGDYRVGVATDLGYADAKVIQALQGVEGLVLEANYDWQMLEADLKRPLNTKQRISSRHGHLSNEQAAELVAELVPAGLKRVVLGHLSSDCNCPLKAVEVVRERAGCGNLEICAASQNEVTEWQSIVPKLPPLSPLCVPPASAFPDLTAKSKIHLAAPVPAVADERPDRRNPAVTESNGSRRPSTRSVRGTMRDSLKSFIPSLSDPVKCRLNAHGCAFVGIDFGTSNTVVSVCGWNDREDDLSVWTLTFDKTPGGAATPLVPTVIYIEQERLLIGQNAKHRGEISGSSKRNYLDSFKMELGYEGGAQYHQFELGRESGKLESVASKLNQILGKRGKRVESENLRIDCPRKATEAFFSILRPFIEDYCRSKFPGKSLKYSVSIPACFGSNQRREYKIALEGAGIPVDERFFIDEPNAAFLSWLGNDLQEDKPIFQDSSKPKNVLVFDFGAGTCDLSVLNVSSSGPGGLKLKNRAVSRFSALGGNDLDREIASRFLFPAICQQNSIDPDFVPPHVYREHFEPKLKAFAEHLKIRASNRLNRENVPFDDRVLYHLDAPLEIKIPPKWRERFTGKGVTAITISEDLEISFGDFEKAVQQFVSGGRGVPGPAKGSLSGFFKRLRGTKPTNEQSILDLLENVVMKAGVNKQEIDYILFIGGSSNLRPVQDAVLEFFDETPEPIIPDDLQTHVSRGVALHSFLSHGLRENPLTEILAEDIYLMVKGGEQLVFRAGKEIPASVAVGSLYKSGSRQRSVELPFLAGNEKRVVARVSTKLPPEITEDDEITLEAEIDSHKIVHLRARYEGGTLLQGEEISPFGQQALDEYSKLVGSMRADLNNALSEEGFSVGEDSLFENLLTFPRSWLKFHRLRDLMHKQGDYLACLDLYEECYPDSWVDLSYFSSRAGEKDLALAYKKKAFEASRCGVSAYNLAIAYPADSEEYIRYIEEACRLGYPGAKIVLARKLRATDPKRSASLMSEGAAHFRSRFENNPDALEPWEYAWISRVADYEEDEKLKRCIEQAEKRRQKASEAQRREIDEGKLLAARIAGYAGPRNRFGAK